MKIGDEVQGMLKKSYLEKLGSSLKAKTVAATALATIVLSAISVQVNPAGLAGKTEAMVTKNPAAVSMFYEAGAQEYRGLPDLSGYELIKVLELDEFKAVKGKDTILKRYVHKKEGRNKMISIRQFRNGKTYGYATKDGKEYHYYQDTDGDGNFETESKKFRIDFKKYGLLYYELEFKTLKELDKFLKEAQFVKKFKHDMLSAVKGKESTIEFYRFGDKKVYKFFVNGYPYMYAIVDKAGNKYGRWDWNNDGTFQKVYDANVRGHRIVYIDDASYGLE